MRRSHFVNSAAVGICLCFGALLLADEAATTDTEATLPAASTTAAAPMPAKQCLTDLQSFDKEMQDDGFWLGGSGYGYGYPVLSSYGIPVMGGDADFGAQDGGGSAEDMNSYQNARPGFEVRTLFVAAHILAGNGQQQVCEEVLTAARNTYKQFLADMKSGNIVPPADEPGWWQQQIAAAQPVTDRAAPFRTDQLIGIHVRNPQNDTIGSVEDIVISPKTGKIAYLVVARGGLFGIDQTYVPVPWEAFKVTPGTTLLVLDTTKDIMEAAPTVRHDQFGTPGQFDQESEKVDSYWKTHL